MEILGEEKVQVGKNTGTNLQNLHFFVWRIICVVSFIEVLKLRFSCNCVENFTVLLLIKIFVLAGPKKQKLKNKCQDRVHG